MDNGKTEKSRDTKSEMVEFTVNGMTMSTILTKKFRNRHRWAKPDDKQISSFIPGTIREVFVKEGDHVQQNDRLLILEAMKMMNVIASPVSCTVARIHVRSGDKVPKGKVMIEIEPD